MQPGCASKGSPGGGPVDKTPPEIIYTFPKTDSVNIKSLKAVEIHFSESIDDVSIFNNIFISPPIKFKVEWESDTELSILFKDSLKTNQTYVVVIGAKVKDIRGNKLSSSFQLAFATGNKIDKGSISGKVWGGEKNESYSVFVYDLQAGLKRFDRSVPDYISQTGKNNTYTVNYLRNGIYRLFAINDQNNNLIIDANLEKLGIPYRDILIDSSHAIFKGLNFQLTKIDTLPPKLSFVRALGNTQVNLNFSEKVKVNSLDQIVITDSISSQPIKIYAASESIEADNILEVFTSAMDSGNIYLCSVSNFADNNGNALKDTMLTFLAKGFAKRDSFKIVAINPADSSLNEHPNRSIIFEFSNPLDKELFTKNFRVLAKDSSKISGIFKFPSANAVEFKPLLPFELNKFYTMLLLAKNIKNVWGDALSDSLINRSFKISDGNNFGEISGNILFESEKIIDSQVQAENYKNTKNIYSTWAATGSKYIIKNIPDGIYRMHAFLDMDTNNVFSAGNLFPFTYSEPFITREDTIKVRKRWESSNVDFSFLKTGN